MTTADSPVPADVSDGVLRGTAHEGVRRALLGAIGLPVSLRVIDAANVPLSGPLLVVANHQHNADPVLLAAACPRPLFFMAKKELFATPGLGWLLERLGAFPVDRGASDRHAIRYAEAVLAQGHALAMFPEGTRSRTGRLGEGLPGAGLILLRSGAPVLPVAIAGSEALPGNGRTTSASGSGWRPEVSVRFGRPFAVSAVDGGRLTSRDATAQMMGAIRDLLPDRYHPLPADGAQ